MDVARWRRLQAAFHQIIDLPDVDRPDAIAAICNGDLELQASLERLLKGDAQAQSYLDAEVATLAEEIFRGDRDGEPRQIGPYHVLEAIGEGGMGRVYRARRADLGHEVAIKTLRDGWVSASGRERFAIEQRTLARLNHPSIASLHDAGTLADGTPYLVMELVSGLPITTYCREREAPLDLRLRLFRAVCDAVLYAHTQPIIHRDLKPSNILVTPEGRVKLLDFGIAKELDSPDARVDQTQWLRMLTPQYAAPEQVRGEPVAVYTDVYGLGLILYELLTDVPAFPVKARTGREAETFVLEHDPVQPSIAAGPARARRASRSAWADLDVLCARAMHKDPERRYQTVEALIRDLDHYERGQPLDARPDTLGYRTRKFAARHSATLALAAAVLIVLAGLVTFYTMRLATARNAAQAQAARTERVQRFMLGLFDAGESDAAPAAELRVVTLVDRGAQEAQSLERDPQIQAELFQTLGSVYQRLGNHDKADIYLQRALDQRVAQLGRLHPDVAESLVALGLLRLDEGRLQEAERLTGEGLDAARAALPATHPRVAEASAAVGKVYEEQGHYDRALAMFEQARSLYARNAQPTPELSAVMTAMANTHFYAGRLDESQALNRELLAIDRQLHGPRHPSAADDLINLGAIETNRGRPKDAEGYYREALDILVGWYTKTHPETASAMTMLAQAVASQGRYDEARDLLREALATQRQVYGNDHPRVAFVWNELGAVAQRQNNLDEAESAFAEALAVYRKAYPDGGQPRIAIALSNLAGVYLLRGEYTRAEPLFRQAVDIHTRAQSADHLNTNVSRIKLGRTLLRLKRYAEAEAAILPSYEALSKQTVPTASWLQAAREDLAIAYDHLGQAERARHFREEFESIEKQKTAAK